MKAASGVWKGILERIANSNGTASAYMFVIYISKDLPTSCGSLTEVVYEKRLEQGDLQQRSMPPNS